MAAFEPDQPAAEETPGGDGGSGTSAARTSVLAAVGGGGTGPATMRRRTRRDRTGTGADPALTIAVGTRVLVTGATGYIGGRLVPRLLAAGYHVRCLARSAGKLRARAWAGDPRVEVVAGDAGDAAAVEAALHGCDAAYYLVHSMVAVGRAYAEHDRALAESFGLAAARAGVRRIVYLGGLGELGLDLSEHLRSRREVERALAAGGVPVTVLRAAMIIGSGSASFEILRYLVERLPLMVTPRWVATPCQPIAVRDALEILVRTLSDATTAARTIDIGGPDVLTYRELMDVMADALGLRRRVVVPVPLLTPRLSSLWIHLVTPLAKDIARPLAEGLRNPVVCRGSETRRLLDRPPVDVRTAIHLALGRTTSGAVETSWSDAGALPGDPDWAGGRVYVDRREAVVGAPPEVVFAVLERIGGAHGWYGSDALWRLRGWLDRLIGGPGLRRGRRDPEHLAFGDAVDFWRVTAVEPGRLLRLGAEMRLPGEATLEFTLEPAGGGGQTRLTQTARFAPRGLAGLVYWTVLLPFHSVVFRGMLEGIKGESEGTRRIGAPVAAPVVKGGGGR